eukprot:TRINITY_DN109855_c0_g1_i1.p1 TRINITY_DN109855_c0_g1~~TRINITY_DN109855_c0_g1_i1.p1  ORF type:complete len:124 (+),score=24.75 TRINITY_DN109855_c0_g1_i1:73-444(+)
MVRAQSKDGTTRIMGGGHRKWLVKSPSAHNLQRASSREGFQRQISIEEREKKLAAALERQVSRESETMGGYASGRRPSTGSAQSLPDQTSNRTKKAGGPSAKHRTPSAVEREKKNMFARMVSI